MGGIIQKIAYLTNLSLGWSPLFIHHLVHWLIIHRPQAPRPGSNRQGLSLPQMLKWVHWGKRMQGLHY